MSARPRPRHRHAAIAMLVVGLTLAACTSTPAASTPPVTGPTVTTNADPGSGTPVSPVSRPTSVGTPPGKSIPSRAVRAAAMPTELVDQRREWWLGEQLAFTASPRGTAYVFFTTLLDPATDDVRLSFTKWDPTGAAWTAPAEVLRGAQIRPLGGPSLGVAADDVTGRVAVVWERQAASGASTGAEIAWTDDGGAGWNRHTIDRPASMPTVALHGGRVYVSFRDLTGMVLASSAAAGTDEAWSLEVLPETGHRRPAATPSVLRFDTNYRPIVSFQTVETDDASRWLTAWSASPAEGAANPIDLRVRDEDEAVRRLAHAAADLDGTQWADANVAVPGKRCSVQVSVAAGDNRIESCPFGTPGNPTGPSALIASFSDSPGPAAGEIIVVATMFTSTVAKALPPGIYVWRGVPSG